VTVVLKVARLVVGSSFEFDLIGRASSQVELEGRADDKRNLEHDRGDTSSPP